MGLVGIGCFWRELDATAKDGGAEDAGELGEAYGGCYFGHCGICLGVGCRRLL